MSELLVYKKTEVLLNQVYPILKNFPKSEKYGLSQEIRQAFYGLLKAIILGNNIKYRRREYQSEADGYLKLLLIYFNLAYEQKYINKKTQYKITLGLEEIGRLLGGWIKKS